VPWDLLSGGPGTCTDVDGDLRAGEIEASPVMVRPTPCC
jgi:hypothetical protein